MTDKFLIAGGVAGNISNGTISIYGSKIGAKNLDPSRSIKTDSQGRLQTVNLDIDDINTLQSQLNSKIGNPFLGTLNVTDLETNEYFSLNDELDNIQYISKSLGLTTISSNILSNDVACSGVLNQISSTRIDMTSPTSIDIQATNFTFNGQPIGGISNPLTSDLVGDGFEIQNIGKITINQTVPFVDVLDINGKFKHTQPSTVVYTMNSDRLGGVADGSLIGVIQFNCFDNTNTSRAVARIDTRSLGAQTATNRGCDYIIRSTLSNDINHEERFKISADGTTYITGGLDLTNDLNMNNNNIVDIGLANYNLETSLLDLTTRTQNIGAIAGFTEILGGMNQKLSTGDTFNISDDNSPFSLLKFNVSNTDILSQIKHVFSNGLETSLNNIGSIGTTLKRFNTLWVNSINGLSPIGGVYMATSNSTMISTTVIEKSLVDSPTFEGSLTIPAGAFQISSYHFNVAGEISTNNGDTLTLRLKNGGELSSIVVALTGSSNEYFELEGDFSIEAIGGLGVARISSNFDFTYSDNASSLRGKRICVVNNTTFDTTVSNTLDLTAQWSSTNANNSIQSFQAVLTKTY
jgi:hypothetical protein